MARAPDRSLPRPRRVGAAAKAAGVRVPTLHYYERQGLVKPRARTAAGYRLYGDSEIRRVRAIKRAQALGFTLAEIRELVALGERGRPSRRVARLAEGNIARIETRLRELGRMRRVLREALATCRCGDDPVRCDALDGLGVERTPGPSGTRP